MTQRPLPQMKDEPDWMRDYRKQNALIVEEKPLAQSKFAKISFWNDQIESFVAGKGNGKMPTEVETHGVKVLTWNQALLEHPNEMKEALLGEKKAKDQYQAFVNAYFTEGFVLVFPKKSDLTIEFFSSGVKGLLQKNVILIPKNVQNISIMERVSAPEFFSATNTTLLLQSESQVSWARLHQYEENSQTLVHQFVVVQQDARAKIGNVWLKGEITRNHALIHLQSQESQAEYREVLVGKKHSNWDSNTLSLHAAPNAFSHVISKTILLDESRNVFDGMIKVEKDAQQTNALLECHSMMLSPLASSNNIPGLEIEADDVKCTHKATMAHIEPEELFYLQSRGISKKVAEQMIASGFLESNLTIFSKSIQDALMKEVDAALE